MIRNNIDDQFLYFFKSGDSRDAYKTFGSHIVKNDKWENIGCEFCVYAPNALYVELIGEWNNFRESEIRMERIHQDGVWYVYLDGNYEGLRYKYVIVSRNGQKYYKADPYAFRGALRPLQDSVVYDIDFPYMWNDQEWVNTHPKTYNQPTLIYEMHLGSWRKTGPGDNDYFNYVDIANMLVDYLKDFGYTHVEVMPVYEHPLDASWGYQGTGYYAITTRYGSPHDFMKFVDILHQHGYGVILDWVPGHICKDSFGLYMFDGSYLYEYPNMQDRENSWGTANLDLGKGSTRSFLLSNAMYFLKYFHADGFRVDAVSNLIYYLGDTNRGVNNGACEFIQKLSNLVFGYDDRNLLIAEDSSAYPNVTKPTSDTGLGFNYKWDMGWMNDTLKYFKLDPVYRKYHHNQLTFSMMYFYNEQFMLPLSHDEVVHMKGSLLNKMPGDQWKQFASYRALIGYMLTHPGKKLLFMGNEMATYDEWHYESELPWFLLEQYPTHKTAFEFVKVITKLYKNEPALWEMDYHFEGFKWIEANNADQSLFVFARFAKNPADHLVVVMNLTPNTYENYRIGTIANYNYEYTEIMNTDRSEYGGSGKINAAPIKVEKKPYQGQKYSMCINVGPLCVQIFKPVAKKKKK